MVCPAMHTEMWEHPAVQDNLAALRRRGVDVVPPEQRPPGRRRRRAGRLADRPSIVGAVLARLGCDGDAVRRSRPGVRVVVSAGGTREPLDPVRFITNRSSGKQGHALAAAAARRGAQVTLVTTSPCDCPRRQRSRGTVDRSRRRPRWSRPCRRAAAAADVVVMAAAVADFRPKAPADDKLTKDDGVPELCSSRHRTSWPALAASGARARSLVGFAAETDDARRARPAQARTQGRRPPRRQRRHRARCRLRPRHQRRDHPRAPTDDGGKSR